MLKAEHDVGNLHQFIAVVIVGMPVTVYQIALVWGQCPGIIFNGEKVGGSNA